MAGDAQAAASPEHGLPAAIPAVPAVPGLPAPGRCLVMGVVNVTPDSFSDGGECFAPGEAIARGLQLAADGADPSLIIVDPGLGFGKLAEHNWALLTRLPDLARLGGGPPFPVLVGASRKRFIGQLLAAEDGTPRSFAGSDDATIALTALAAAAGAWCVRVHVAGGNADAVRAAARWGAASPGGGVPG